MKVLRCPGYKAPDTARADHHSGWNPRPNNPPSRRYHCQQCDAYYPYLVDVATSPMTRHAPDSLGPIHPDDTNSYGNA